MTNGAPDRSKLGNWAWRIAAVLATLVALVLTLRILQSERQPDLKPWHTWAPREADAGEIARLDWPAWRAAEDRLFADMRQHLREKIEPADRVAANRYFEGSPLYSARFAHDWNRSYELLPADEPAGAVVLLHGLSDSPYSLRHVAQDYVSHGFAAIGMRLPGHGTVPAGLTRAKWQDWRAATRLAMREARRLAGPGKPIHIVGYSNGGALAMQYTLDAAADPGLELPARVVLLSPMIGLTRFARYAGVAGWPALLPRFSKAAWLDIVPEFNPFKYNSFPVNAARQSYELTQVIDEQIASAVGDGSIAKVPPILAFQSVVDSTIAGEALVSTLFARLPENGSELVLFDVNRATPFDILMSGPALSRLEQMLPPGPQRYRVTVIGNSTGDPRATESSRLPGAANTVTRALDIEYPRSFFSLSHVAIPFPPGDSLYGTEPDDEDFGVHLGIQSPRGERGTLIRGADTLVRASCNPFFPYLSARIEETLPH
jgi:alpha-beta hydrolase superfamily lysophospholipase